MSGEGCDCTELCSMGPTCPGGILAGLPGSGCAGPEDEDPAVEYGLLYPFTACTSNGGPYDDQSFVAGVQFGEARIRAMHKEPFIELTVHPDLVQQLDLLAMHEGYLLAETPWEDAPEEWTFVEMVLGSPTADESNPR